MSRLTSVPSFNFDTTIARSMVRLDMRLIGGAKGAGTACLATCKMKTDAPFSERFLINSSDKSLFWYGNPHNYEFYCGSAKRWAPAEIDGEKALKHHLEELFGSSIVWYENGECNLDDENDEPVFDWQLKVGSFMGLFTQSANGQMTAIDEDQAIEYLSSPKERAHIFDSAYIYFDGIENPIDKDGKYQFGLVKPVLVFYKEKALLSSKKLTAGVVASTTSSKPSFKPMSKETKQLKATNRQEKKNRYSQAKSGNFPASTSTPPVSNNEGPEENMMM